MTAGSCWRATPAGLELRVRLTPRGGRDAIEGVRPGPDGAPALAVRVAAAPTGGAANAALEALVAKAAGVPKSAVRVTRGATSRLKTLTLDGDAAALGRALGL